MELLVRSNKHDPLMTFFFAVNYKYSYNPMGAGACCHVLNLTIDLPGKEGLAYNIFSGEYHVTNEYTDNGMH